MELCQAYTIIAAHGLKQEAAEYLDGIGAFLVDVVARVPADKPLQLSTHEE